MKGLSVELLVEEINGQRHANEVKRGLLSQEFQRRAQIAVGKTHCQGKISQVTSNIIGRMRSMGRQGHSDTVLAPSAER